MSRKKATSTPRDLLPIAERLQAGRPEPTAHELDRVKLRALSQVERARTPRLGRSGAIKSSRRVVTIALAIGLMSGGTAVIAKSGGPSSAASSSSSANSQYCPPSSQQPGKPKQPGPSKCGNPKTK